MSSKTVSLEAETYERLRRAKGEDESFSDVVDRLLGNDEHPLYDLVGALDDEEAETLRERSRSFRSDVVARVGTDGER
ncbi:antitoxin VapB family protein [Halorientalis halophila]|uniref:antitoxin VapB family protein n=1 Tax=Halorientalis halophila TaxID=3108499 RepID=UPI00300BEEC6